MFQLKIEYPTYEAFLEAVTKLGNDNRQGTLNLIEEPKKPTKAAEKKAAIVEATAAGLEAPKKPAAVKGKTKYTLDQLKSHMATLVDPKNGEAIKAFARSFGVAKFADLSEAQIQEAYTGAEAFFSAPAVEETEEDPMG